MKRIDPEELMPLLGTGLEEARKAKEFGAIFGTDIRAVTIAVRELIQSGLPVASSTDNKDGGYYITSTREEADHYILFMRSHILELARRLRDYKRAAKHILQPGQLPLLFSKDIDRT